MEQGLNCEPQPASEEDEAARIPSGAVNAEVQNPHTTGNFPPMFATLQGTVAFNQKEAYIIARKFGPTYNRKYLVKAQVSLYLLSPLQI